MKISEFPFFRDLNDRDTQHLNDSTRKLHFAAGETILAKGAAIECVYFIVDGRVKETTYTRSGKEIVFNTLVQGDCFGIVSPLRVEGSKSDFIACTETEVFAVHAAEFLRLMRTHASVSESVLDEVSRVADKFSDKLYEIRAMDVSARTRAELLRHTVHDSDDSDPEYVEFDYLPTHEEIANTIFTHREAVTREISKLKRDGVIVKTAQNRLLANVNMLAKMVGEFS